MKIICEDNKFWTIYTEYPETEIHCGGGTMDEVKRNWLGYMSGVFDREVAKVFSEHYKTEER